MVKEITMSHDELKQLHTRLDQVEKQISEIFEQNKRQFQMLEPMYNIFTSVKGFNGISAVILKAIVMIGAGVGVVYALLKWLKT